jgi:hypothetical protein
MMASKNEQDLTALAGLMRTAQTLATWDEADYMTLGDALDAIDDVITVLDRLSTNMRHLRTITQQRHDIQQSQAWAARKAGA